MIGQAQSSNRALTPIAQSGILHFPFQSVSPNRPTRQFCSNRASLHQAVPGTLSLLAVTPFLPLPRNRSIGPGPAIGSIGQAVQSPSRAKDPIGPIGQLANREIGQVLQSCNRACQPIAQSLTCSNLPIGHPRTFEVNRSNRAQSVLQRCSKLAATPSQYSQHADLPRCKALLASGSPALWAGSAANLYSTTVSAASTKYWTSEF